MDDLEAGRRASRSFGILPVVLWRHIFAFVAPPPDDALFFDETVDTGSYLQLLANLACVCKPWYAYAKAEHQRCTSAFQKVEITDSMLPLSIQDGADAVALSVTSLVPKLPTDQGIVDASGRRRVESFFHSFQNIVRLELVHGCGDLIQVLEAAASQCVSVRALVIRNKYRNAQALEQFLTSLELALQQWYRSTGGLRLLAIGTVRLNDSDTAERLMALVTAYCPHIEALRATKFKHGATVSLATWQAFWQTCRSVRAFEWERLRWSGPHCRAFAAFPQPALEVWCLDGGSWDWAQHDAALLTDLVRAVPRVETLRLRGNAVGLILTEDTPRMDAFVCLAAAHCPRLQRVSEDADLPPLTSETIKALASANSMSVIRVNGMYCDNDLLVDMFERFPKGGCAQRSLEIGVCFDETEMFLTFLEYLARLPAGALADVRLWLKIVVHEKFVQQGCLPGTLKQLLADIRRKHARPSDVDFIRVLYTKYWETCEVYITSVEMKINVP